jgi:hypothetical protein
MDLVHCAVIKIYPSACSLFPLPAAQLGMWFKDLFHRPFGWALSHPSAVETTKVGRVGWRR